MSRSVQKPAESLSPGTPGLGEHMHLLDRALFRGDLDAASDLIARVPKADLSPFLRNAAGDDNAEATRFLLARGARLRPQYPLGGRVEVGAGAYWSADWIWREIEDPARRFREKPRPSFFTALDAAIVAGATSALALLIQAFPGAAAARSPYFRSHLVSDRASYSNRGALASAVELPDAASVFAFSRRLEERPDLAQKIHASLKAEGVDFTGHPRSDSPLSLACKLQRSNLATLLLSDPDFRPTRAGAPPLSSCAAQPGDTTLLEMLLDAGENPNWAPAKEPPPLWIAIERRHFDAAQLLLSRGARINFSHNGVSLIQRAAELGFGLPTALIEEAQIARSVHDGAESIRKREKKAFAKQKRELAEREGISVEEAGERLRAQKEQEAAQAAAAQSEAPVAPSRRGRRL